MGLNSYANPSLSPISASVFDHLSFLLPDIKGDEFNNNPHQSKENPELFFLISVRDNKPLCDKPILVCCQSSGWSTLIWFLFSIFSEVWTEKLSHSVPNVPSHTVPCFVWASLFIPQSLANKTKVFPHNMYHCINTTHPIHSWSKKAPTPHSQTLQPSLAVRHYREYQAETRDIYRVSRRNSTFLEGCRPLLSCFYLTSYMRYSQNFNTRCKAKAKTISKHPRCLRIPQNLGMPQL